MSERAGAELGGMPLVGEHDRRLLAEVRPPDWDNPRASGRYHLVVVGAGTAGLVAAAGAAGLGARTALVERGLMGGDCLNVGCVPSKAVLRAARAWHEARTARRRFGGPAATGDGDFATAMERMRAIRAGIAPHDGARRFTELGVDVYLGEGRFTGRDTLVVAGRQLRFRRAVIATGARPAVPPIPGLDGVAYLTNETVFSLTELPPRLGVIGGGPIGCELAQAFARFGSAVSLFEIADRLLVREDADAAAIVQSALVRDGVELFLGARVAQVEGGNGEIRVAVRGDSGVRRVAVDALLVAVGRTPNVEDLGLREAGVETGGAGVLVDDRLRTTNRRVFACGDVASHLRFTHNADAQARIVVQNALFYGRKRESRLVVPRCTYTSPELAHVGMAAAEARQAGHSVETLTIPLADADRARLDGEEEGFLRVHHAKGRLLGATLVAARAGEAIGELVLAITHGVGLAKISGTIHPYPTQAEVIRKAGDAYRRRSLTPLVRRFLALWFRIF